MMVPSLMMDQSMASSKSIAVESVSTSNLDDYIYDAKRTLYRHLSMEGKLATIFDIEDSRSYYNWQLVMGNIRIHRRWFVPSPRFRELIDNDLGMMAFEVTGDYDGSVSMICPSSEGERSMAEELPILNFILNDMDCYSSVEIIVVTINPDSIENGEYETNYRKIVARNYRSRTVINESVLKVHFKLRSSWNYAYLNLEELVKASWGESYLVTTMIKINANTRVRRVFFSDEVYAYEDFPPEFILEIDPIPSTVEYFTPEQQYPPDRHPKLRRLYKTPLDANRFLSREEYANMMKLHKASHSDFIKSLAERQQDNVRGLTLALISKEDRLLPHSVKIKIRGKSRNWIPEVTVTDSSAEIPGAALDPDAEAEAKRAEDERLAAIEAEKNDFCNTVWNRNPLEEGQFVEWDLIESFDTNPQKLVQIHRQRRGEGFYDVYTGQMLPTKTAEADISEMDAPNVIPPVDPEELLPKFRQMLGVKKLEPYMQQRGAKVSLIDPDADLDYLKACNFRPRCGPLAKGKVKVKAKQVKGHDEGEEEDEEGDEEGDNEGEGEEEGDGEEDEEEDGEYEGEEEEGGSESEESIPCSEDDGWGLTWTFDGMEMDDPRPEGKFFDDSAQNSQNGNGQRDGFKPKLLPHRTFETHVLK